MNMSVSAQVGALNRKRKNKGEFMRKQLVELTNMCLIYDENRILVEERKGDGYSGLIFPGGHIEPGESITDSVIREIKEETGLDIRNPKPCGFKDWIQEDGTRYIVLLYKTDQYSGELKSSEEGRVFWLDRKDISDANLIWNMRELLSIFEGNEYSEFFFEYKNGSYEPGKLLG